MLVTTEKLSRHFGGLRAVEDIDLAISPREIHAIIGPNGAGKTTLVSLISGKLAPSSGRVLFQGHDITALPAWQRVRLGIAYTFQITSIYPTLTLYDNVALAAQMTLSQSGLRGADFRTAMDDLVLRSLHRAGLDIDPNQRAGETAYGHQRLLEIAMGLALEPALLILDEPTQGLADAEISTFIDLVRALGKQATVLLIEHNIPVVTALAERVTVLAQGRLLAQGSPAEISANEAVQAAYLGR